MYEKKCSSESPHVHVATSGKLLMQSYGTECARVRKKTLKQNNFCVEKKIHARVFPPSSMLLNQNFLQPI